MSGQAASKLAAGAGLLLTGAALVALWRSRRSKGNHHAASSLSRSECAHGRHFHVFFSHDWGAKHHNHARVRRIYERLRDLWGMSVWFDEEHMHGDLDESMCKGIQASEVFAAFITEKYLQKVTGEDEQDKQQDNCKKEFNFAKQKLGPQRMVCIVMEKQCRTSGSWPGQVGMYCGGRLYVDFSDSDDSNFDAKINLLANHILNTSGRNPGQTNLGSFQPPRTPGGRASEKLAGARRGPMAGAPAAGNTERDADYIDTLMQIVGSSVMDSEKSVRLTDLLSGEGSLALAPDTRTQVVACFIGKGRWNVDAQKFDGAPDWEHVGARLFELVEARSRGTSEAGATYEWAVTATGTPCFAVDWLGDDAEDILFHFNPRPSTNTIVMNSFEAGTWGDEEYIETVDLDSQARWLVKVDQEGFHVSVSNLQGEQQELHLFAHRLPWACFSQVQQKGDVDVHPVRTRDEDAEVLKFTVEVHELQEAGDIYSILAAMRRLLSHGIVQQLGCAALKQIAFNTENQTLIFGAGGVRGVITAMRRHKKHAGVQGAGCGVLCNVGVVAEHKQGIAGCGGIETVLEALREHPQHVAVQKQGLSALRILAVDEQVAFKVANGGGIQLIADAMRALPENAKVQQRACRALLQIGWSDAGVQARIRESGVVDLVERAVRAPTATSKCRQKGQELLVLLSK